MSEMSYILTKDEANKLSFILAKSKEKELNQDEIKKIKSILVDQYPWVQDLKLEELVKLGLIVIGAYYIMTNLLPQLFKTARRKRRRKIRIFNDSFGAKNCV